MGRRFGVQVSDGVRIGLSATAIVIPYPEALLTKAQELIANGDFSIAVVVAHMVQVESSRLHCSGTNVLSKEGTFCFRPALVNNG
jgi:hypothetical protein